MKILAFSDTHLRSSAPSCRKDAGSFYDTQMAKFKEVVELSKSLKVDAVINGGDLFDSFDSTHRLIFDTIQILNNRGGIPWYVNPGNHDIFGCSMDTLRRSSLGILEQAGCVNIVREPVDVPIVSNVNVIARFIPYRLDMPDSAWFSGGGKPPNVVHIIVPHWMLTPHWVPFPHTLLSDVKTDAEMILCSHFHAQFIERHGNTIFANSGPLTRQTVNEAKLNPAVLLVECNGGKVDVKLIPISHKPASEVIDETRTVIPEREGLAEQFLATLKSSALESLDRAALIRTVGQQKGFDTKVVEHGLGRLKEIEKTVGIL